MCFQVEISVASLNHYDAFLYDDGRDLFVFVGKQAARLKHAKAFEVALRIKDSEYHGSASVIAIEGMLKIPGQTAKGFTKVQALFGLPHIKPY